MKIGILGSGDVAKSLARGFKKHGNDVKLGTRDLSKVTEFPAGSFAEVAAFGEVIVLATHGDSTVEIVRGIDAQAFAGKVVMDVTNPLEVVDGAVRLSVGFDDSLGEQIQRAIPNAHVVKVFNTVGHQLMIDPQLPGGPPDMFIAGNHDGAKEKVAGFVEDFGWNCTDMGDMTNARLLEPMCMVWVTYGRVTGQWEHAFKFIRK